MRFYTCKGESPGTCEMCEKVPVKFTIEEEVLRKERIDRL